MAVPNLSSTPHLPSYTITERLYQGLRTAVYRATREDSHDSVVIKLLQRDYPSFGELVQFRNQYAVVKHLPIAGIVHPLALERYGTGYALVMEDWGGISLGQHIQQQTLMLLEVLSIGVQLADILHELHQHRVIHKDIKPANILIRPDSMQVKLIDFSIASLLPKETQTLHSPNTLEGTLAYLAPEQTGRMNRGIDYRADYYSLGVTLYQLLTGELPFTATDPLEMVHCHIAQVAASASQLDPVVPRPVGDIVAKLMAKNAEDRYQSALGLKYDLEKCLTQLEETGEIVSFELGQRDLCDRFTIPEKLYGRDAEVQTLLDAFERVAGGASELMLVAGFSGIGKTAVVNEVHKPIARQRGYFIKGKFDQFNRNIPLSAFVQALRDLMGQLLSESDVALAQWQARILDTVGDNGQVLIEVIPELEGIIGPQPDVPELSGSAAENRFNRLFGQFISIFTTAEHSLTLFIDDFQWADSASLKLMKVLMEDNGYLLMLGAYRDNEVSPVHPFIMTVEELQKASKTVNIITLEPLTFEDTNNLIADTLHCSPELARPLTKLVDRKTQGNPFFTTQFLKVLYKDGQIAFDRDRGYWECDITQVQQLTLTDNVVEFMAAQLQKLSTKTQEILKLAACIGNQFDLEILAIVSEQTEMGTATTLWEALQEGVILPLNNNYKFFQTYNASESDLTGEVSTNYKFLHDRVQQASYTLIPEGYKQSTHLNIGQLLLKTYHSFEREEKVFEIVNQLNIGRELINDPIQRNELAHLNLKAGRKAKASMAYNGALEYLRTGIQLLTEKNWENEYELSLALYFETIESCYLNSEFSAAEAYRSYVLERVNHILDTVRIYELTISQRVAEQNAREALAIGLEFLESLGLSRSQILQYGKREFTLPTVEGVANVRVMSDPLQLALMRILVASTTAALSAEPALLLPMVSTQIHLSLENGHSGLTAFSYSWYGCLRCGELDGIEDGYQAGQLALVLLDRFEAEVATLKSQVMNMVYSFSFVWKNHLKRTLTPLLKTFQCGIDSGDLIYASYGANNYCINALISGQSLPKLLEKQTFYIREFNKKKIGYTLDQMEIWRRFNLSLQGLAENPHEWTDKAIFDPDFLSDLIKADDLWSLFLLHTGQGMLLFLWGNYSDATAQLEAAEEYTAAVGGWTSIGIQNFYQSLSLLALYNAEDFAKQYQLLERIAENQKQMQVWAEQAPMNYAHKYCLVEAEKYRISRAQYEAADYYDRAIAGAKANEFIQEEALANELAAKFYLNWGKEKIAAGYMQEAYYCYARWGAKAKTDHLEATYPQLLAPILQHPQSSTALRGTTVLSSPSIVRTSSSNATLILDISAAIKASQALSGEIQLDALLARLMQIVLEIAGADKGVFVLKSDDTWDVVAQDIGGDCQITCTPLDAAKTLPVSMVRAVQRTHESVILNQLARETRFASEPYLIKRQPKSVLCAPILNQGQLIGILYLENNISAGAFTQERLEVLNLICSQAAISLENSRLYEKARESNQRLQQSFEDLQTAQLQLVQSEKMSTLGNLVAGVAHEINNPISFISGNLKPARDYVKGLLRLIDLYQDRLPSPDEGIEEEIEALDLDFVREDLPKLIDSMNLGVDRIRHISTSLRTFSRTDKEHKISFDLHEGIDSTLLVLKHRLKANENRPEIKIIKEYGTLPEVQCFPGQLNQVFMNLIANSIDALEEGNGDRNFEEIAKNPNQIRISTEAISQEVTIRICDNGAGMSDEVRERIFEQGFTTKGVGKGTGLGMAIARQIVVEKHGGILEVFSAPGEGTQFVIALHL